MTLLSSTPSWSLAVLSGIGTGAAFLHPGLGWLAWISLTPLVELTSRESGNRAFVFHCLSGFLANGVALHWLSVNQGTTFPTAALSMVAAAAYLALFWGIRGWLISTMRHRFGGGIAWFPVVWITVEWLQSIGPLGFPWVSLATTQTAFLPAIQFAELFGIWGISFWVAVTNIFVYLTLVSLPRRRYLHALLLVAVLPWVYGYARLAVLSSSDEDATQFRVGVVQSNIGPHEKWSVENRGWIIGSLDSLYRVSATDGADLVLWPEAAAPAYFRRSRQWRDYLSSLVAEHSVPILTGTVDWEYSNFDRAYFNGAVLADSSAAFPFYHKNHLVPFGEFIPLANLFPRLRRLNLGQGDFSQGREAALFSIGDVQVSPLICYESSFPALARRSVRMGADLLAVVVNDGWYGRSAELKQHLAASILRAIEARRPVARCANTGISAIIDARGIIREQLPAETQGVTTATVPLASGSTLYTRVGDLAPWSAAGSILLFIGGVFLRERRSRVVSS